MEYIGSVRMIEPTVNVFQLIVHESASFPGQPRRFINSTYSPFPAAFGSRAASSAVGINSIGSGNILGMLGRSWKRLINRTMGSISPAL